MNNNASGCNRRQFLRNTALATTALGVLPNAFAAPPTIVDTSAGKLRGVEVGGVKIFKGVQYAQAPTGKGRFKAASATAQWSGVKDALDYGNCSPQGQSLVPERPRGGLSLQGEGATYAEDCLYLNVWTPQLNEGKRPVMVWLHGGGFSSGSGGSPLYDGTNLARTEDVVVLTINHRLNAFGYLDLSAIGGDEYADSSSAGMHDIILSLKWVRDNIAQFGGDPNNVTIFGESGGGRKVSVLMAMPEAQGLFHRAIVQSGSALRMDTADVGEERARFFLEALGLSAKQFNKALDLPAEQLLAAMNKAVAKFGQFRPTMETPALPAHPFDPAAPTMSATVPMMIGTNLTEASFRMSFDPRITKADDAAAIEQFKAFLPAADAARVYGRYKKIFPDLKPRDIIFRAATDRGYFLDSTIQAALKADLNQAPAFLYSFDWPQPLAGGGTHAPHGSEIAFAFNNTYVARGEAPETLAATMAQSWANFARTGNPSGERIGQWTPYNSKTRPTMILDKECRMENDPRGEQREIMLSFGSQQYAKREVRQL